MIIQFHCTRHSLQMEGYTIDITQNDIKRLIILNLTYVLRW